MPIDTSDPALPVEAPEDLIRSRIREKRIFEAKFLCRQLSNALDGRDKEALTGEVAELLAHVEQLRRQARELRAEGAREQAAEMYEHIEAIAIDVPGVAEEKRALQGAEAIAAKLGGRFVEAEPPAPLPSPDVRSEERIEPAGVVPRKQEPVGGMAARPERNNTLPRRRRIWLTACLLGLVLVAVLAWQWRRQSLPLGTVPPQVTQKIIIRPLEPPSAPPVAQAFTSHTEPQTDPARLSEAPDRPPVSPSLHLGTLRVEQSARK